MLVFNDGWDSDNNNNSPNRLSKDDLEAAIRAAVAEMRLRTNDAEFLFLANTIQSPSTMLKSYVMKGMHQESGNQILPETHCTVDVPNYPYRRTYHIWYMWYRKGKTSGWQATKVSYEYEKNTFKNVALL